MSLVSKIKLSNSIVLASMIGLSSLGYCSKNNAEGVSINYSSKEQGASEKISDNKIYLLVSGEKEKINVKFVYPKDFIGPPLPGGELQSLAEKAGTNGYYAAKISGRDVFLSEENVKSIRDYTNKTILR